ncbi:MAG: 16S rRNA (guanine(966)-N(2))-methyltransferase RsmD [Omnitrophica WOR_2 bacterium RIFCSPHIGHO2_02_FULL_50_17]|nr:MAG: 16S rRNA (guanine(966)-N(2))-methyltransferase RsmD [Omnitrophica WOR_2 bacterium RIFCSPHIGHO2_02_FULL_50_17]
MKIIGGKFKGRNFYMPQGIQPTQNIARKAVFDLMGQDLSGLTFLDLFAGSGAVGLEAVSRGASGVTFVEKEPRFAEIIRENADLLKVPLGQGGDSPCKLINTDAFAAVKVLAREGRKFHIVFADPPYGLGLAKKILKTLGAYDIVMPTSTVILQHERREILPAAEGRLLLLRQRKYGNTWLSIYGC